MEVQGELVEDGLQVGDHLQLSLLQGMQRRHQIPRVWAPPSDCKPKLTLRAMTVERRSRSARLLSAGRRRSSAQVIEAVNLGPEDMLACDGCRNDALAPLCSP